MDKFDGGDDGMMCYMAADLSIPCSSSEYTVIKVLAVASLLIVTPLTLGAFFICLLPIRQVLETRTKRKCSPLIGE